MSSAAEVFISYAKENLSVAMALTNYLEKQGVNCWTAYKNIPPGGDYAVEIPKAINNVSAVIVIFSSDAQHSLFVRKEVDYALSQKPVIPIIPFLIENIEPNESYRWLFSNVQWLNAFPGKPERFFPLLSDSIQKNFTQAAVVTVALKKDKSGLKGKLWQSTNTWALIVMSVILTAGIVFILREKEKPDTLIANNSKYYKKRIKGTISDSLTKSISSPLQKNDTELQKKYNPNNTFENTETVSNSNFPFSSASYNNTESNTHLTISKNGTKHTAYGRIDTRSLEITVLKITDPYSYSFTSSLFSGTMQFSNNFTIMIISASYKTNGQSFTITTKKENN